MSIKAIYACARDLNLDEDTRRDIYEAATGKRSLKAMTGSEQGRVLKALRDKGAKPAFKRKPLGGPYAKLLQALWLDAWNLGIVRSPADEALLAFIERQTGIQRTEFLRDAADAQKAVEALKKWIAREGGVKWHLHKDPQEAVIAAQMARLGMNEVPALLKPVGLMQAMGREIRRSQ